MKKSIIALAVAAAISSSLIPGALAATTPTFTITRDGGYNAKPGDEIVYTVRLANAEGIEQIGSVIDYKSDVLTYVSSEVCMDYSYSTTQEYLVPAGNTLQASITFSGKYNVTDSAVYKVTFKVNDDAEGWYSDPVTLRYGKNGVTYQGSSVSASGNVNNNNYNIRNLYVGDAADVIITPDRSEAVCGDDITYTVSFPKEFEADGVDITVSYPDNFEFTGKEALVNGTTIEKTNDGVKMVWLSMTGNNRKFSGDFAKLTFRPESRGWAYVNADPAKYSVGEKDYEINFNTNSSEIFVSGSTDVNITANKYEVVSGDKVHVSVSTANAADLEGVAFTLNFDNTMFKLAEAPVNNVVKTDIGTAYCDEEGKIQYKYIALTPANNLNGEVELISFDLIATGSGNGSNMWFEDIDRSLGDVVEFNDSSEIYIYPKNDDEVIEVQALIDAIPEITPENYNSEEVSEAVITAESRYNMMPEVKREKVDRTKLDAAKTMIADYTSAADKAAADAVKELLAALSVTEENWQDAPEAIAAAKTAYDALSDAAKVLVEEYDEKITAAQNAYADFAKAAADKAAADAAAAAVASSYINAIGEVTENSGNAIALAEDVYGKLTDDQKALVSDEVKETLTSARAAYDAILAQKAEEKAAKDKADADAVKELIDALNVTEENWQATPEAIAAIKTAYDALSDEAKALVEGYDEKVAAAQDAYAEFSKAAADKAAADAAAAAVAAEYIEAIGEVTENSGNAIAMAENVYSNLTDDQKALVSDENKEKLTAARKAYDAILAQKAEEEAAKAKAEADKAAANAVSAVISALDVNAPTFTDDVKSAQEAYDALTDDQKALVDNYSVIATKTAEYDALKDILVTVENIGGSYIVTSTERKPLEAHQTVIAVSYNKDLVASVKFMSSDNGKAVVSGDSVKAFVWNSANGMIPYASVEKVEK